MKDSDYNRLLEELFNERTPFGDYRPEQEEMVRRMWRHIEYRPLDSAYAPNMIQEGGTGLGKTIGALALAACLALRDNKRTIIAVNSIALREQIVETLPIVQDAIAKTCARLGFPPPRQITAQSFASPTQYISRTHVEKINDWAIRADERPEWNRFYAFVKRHDSLVEIHDWYAESDGNPLPLQLSPLNIGLDTDDVEDMKLVMEQQQAALASDILICTHTAINLLTWRMRLYDIMEKKALDSGIEFKPPAKDHGDYDLLIIDEAHRLPGVTRSAIEQTQLFSPIRELLNNAPMNTSHALDLLDNIEDHVRMRLGERRRFEVEAPDAYHAFMAVLRPFDAELHNLYRYYGETDEHLFIAKLEVVLDSLSDMMRQWDRAGASSDSFFRDLSDADAYPVMIRRGKEYGVRFEAGRVGRKIASLWRRNPESLNKRLVKSVIMMSGTLIDGNPDPQNPYSHFRREIGATRTAEPHRDAVWYGSAIPSVNVGGAINVVFADRSTDLFPSESDELDGSYQNNPKHTDYLIKMLSQAFAMKLEGQANRILVLFMSEQALSAANTAMARHPRIVPHVISQHRGMRFLGAPLQRFRDDPQAVLLSMNWQGINAVDTEGRSLVDHLVISKLPIPPVNERRLAHEKNKRLAHQAAFEEAIWHFRQGIGRATRDKSARFHLWICDPRMPLPNELAQEGYPKYVRQRESSFLRDSYGNFERLISQRLFGQYGVNALLAEPVQMGYFTKAGEMNLHEVMLSTRPEDRLEITPRASWAA